jgi:dienelactone hydrolase
MVMAKNIERLEEIPVGDVELEGKLNVPNGANGLVIFAHGAGSSRKSPRNNYVAEVLRNQGPGTLLFDLLTEEEDRVRENRFDIPLLVERLLEVTEWVRNQPDTQNLNLGYFGSSTGAASALLAAAEQGSRIDAVVSRGGRVDMASERLEEIECPTLFIVGGNDTQVLELNQEAYEQLECKKELEVIPGAGHLFEGEDELEQVAQLAADWFGNHLSDRSR